MSELKKKCKIWGIRGYSKYNKADLIEFIISQRSDEEMRKFMETEGTEKLLEVFKDALDLMDGKSVSGEKFSYIESNEGKYTMAFDGMNWNTVTHVVPEKICAPDFEYNCECRNFNAGGLCIHYWFFVLYGLVTEIISKECLGQFGTLLDSNLKNIIKRGKDLQEKLDAAEVDESAPMDELLENKTKGTRFKKAKEELGLVEGKEKVVEVEFPQLLKKPALKLRAEFFRLDDGKKNKTSLNVFIDEKNKKIAHEGCPDFQFRMMRNKQFCKHLIQVFLLLDEDIAKPIVARVAKYDFSLQIPTKKIQKAEVGENVKTVDVEVSLEDLDELKETVIEYLFEHSDTLDDDKKDLSLSVIQKEFGKNVKSVLDVLVSEGMVEEFKDGFYKIK